MACVFTGVLNTYAVFIVFTMMWFGCFLVCVEAGLFCNSEFPLYSCCGAGVQDSCGAPLLPRTLKLLCGLGLTENVTGLQKVLPEILTKKKEKRQFSTKAPGGLIDKHYAPYSPPCDNILFLKTPSSWAEETRGRRSGGGHKRSASWGSAEHLREASTSVHLVGRCKVKCVSTRRKRTSD